MRFLTVPESIFRLIVCELPARFARVPSFIDVPW